jgi:hypothetical protein
MMKFRDSANGKAQREKLQNDFLDFNNNAISPTKKCFYEKGYEYLDVSSRNMYVSYVVSTYEKALLTALNHCKMTQNDSGSSGKLSLNRFVKIKKF